MSWERDALAWGFILPWGRAGTGDTLGCRIGIGDALGCGTGNALGCGTGVGDALGCRTGTDQDEEVSGCGMRMGQGWGQGAGWGCIGVTWAQDGINWEVLG